MDGELNRPTWTEQTQAWLLVAAQSFGGGQATLELIRREFVVKRRWVTEEAFARDWALCQTAPGMNLIAMTILVGRGLGGGRGVLIAMLALLVPTGLVTVALAVLFNATQGLPDARAAMRGVVPATVGIGLASSWRTIAPLLRGGFARGRVARLAAIALPILGLSTFFWSAPIIAVLVVGALIGAAAWSVPPAVKGR